MLCLCIVYIASLTLGCLFAWLLLLTYFFHLTNQWTDCSFIIINDYNIFIVNVSPVKLLPSIIQCGLSHILRSNIWSDDNVKVIFLRFMFDLVLPCHCSINNNYKTNVQKQHERGMAIWIGPRKTERAVCQHMITPRQPTIKKTKPHVKMNKLERRERFTIFRF